MWSHVMANVRKDFIQLMEYQKSLGYSMVQTQRTNATYGLGVQLPEERQLLSR